MVRGKRKHKTEEPKAKAGSLFVRASYDTNSPVKKESKIEPIRKATSNLRTVDTVKTQSKSCIRIDYISHGQENSSTKVAKGNTALTLAHYLFRDAQTVSTCIPAKNEIVSDVEEFKTDETPVAVPIHVPSTPHRINMPLENVDEGSTITTKEKPSMIALLSPLQVIKKPALRGRKKAACNQPPGSHRLPKSPAAKTNHSITDYFPVRRSVRKSKKVVLEEKQRDLENKVLSQLEEGLEVKHFAGKGRGVITTREFAKGEFVVEYVGELINQGEAREREKVYAQDQNTGCYMYYFQHRNQQYCVDATAETDKLGRLVNHSRNGNLVARIVEVDAKPHLVLTAKEDIPIGMEVSYDYGDRSRESIRHHPWLAL